LNLEKKEGLRDSEQKGLAHPGGKKETMTPKPGSKNGPFKITPTTCAALSKGKRESKEDF
jgi:hypothetical protein